MIPFTAAGGVLFRVVSPGNIDVLLIKRNNLWDLPKGKLEVGESVQACAVREVSEELGIPMPSIICSLDATLHTYELDDELIAKTTFWYLMYAAEQSYKPQTEEGITEVKWVSLPEAFSMVAFENLRMVLRRAADVLATVMLV